MKRYLKKSRQKRYRSKNSQKVYGRTSINIGGIQPYPFRGDIGSALKRVINKRRSSYPLKKFMDNRIKALSEAAGEDYNEFYSL